MPPSDEAQSKARLRSYADTLAADLALMDFDFDDRLGRVGSPGDGKPTSALAEFGGNSP